MTSAQYSDVLRAPLDGARSLDVSNPLLRYGLYTALLLAVLALILRMAMVEDSTEQLMFREGGLIEWLQVCLLAGAVTAFAVTAFTCPQQGRSLGIVLAAMAMVAVIREFDSSIDRLIPLLGWQLPATCCLIVAIYVAVRSSDAFFAQLAGWLQSSAFGLTWSGAILVLVFAQLIGQADLWQGIMGDAYERGFKRVVEESSELFGYALLLLGAVETLVLYRRSAARAGIYNR